MKQSLSIKLGQQLKMTPQLQQAIRLLQLSTLELEQEIQDCIDGNPMLETEDDWTDSADDTSAESGDDFSENDPSLEPLDSASAENNGNESGTDFDDDYTTGDLRPGRPARQLRRGNGFQRHFRRHHRRRHGIRGQRPTARAPRR